MSIFQISSTDQQGDKKNSQWSLRDTNLIKKFNLMANWPHNGSQDYQTKRKLFSSIFVKTPIRIHYRNPYSRGQICNKYAEQLKMFIHNSLNILKLFAFFGHLRIFLKRTGLCGPSYDRRTVKMTQFNQVSRNRLHNTARRGQLLNFGLSWPG